MTPKTYHNRIFGFKPHSHFESRGYFFANFAFVTKGSTHA